MGGPMGRRRGAKKNGCVSTPIDIFGYFWDITII